MTPKHLELESLAYALWEARGRPDGSAHEDWSEAERQLSGRTPADEPRPSSVDEASKDSFPASDAPASHLPDRPPSNAAAKWSASAAAKSNGKAGRVRR